LPGQAVGQATGRVEGDVTSAEDDQPLPGVNVVLQGTSQGTATGVNGAFTIENVEPGEYTLAVSFVGYKDQSREIEVASGETIEVNFTLQSSVGDLDEMIVVGYTEKSRRELTSSVETVSETELEDVTANDATSLLQGKSAGLYVTTGSGDPGARPSIRVRGTGSITAGAEPLYVVDGTISGGVLPDPSNIESVTVLKDAAASALYGSRAANGVIVINTKQGTRGGETEVNVEVNSGLSEQTTGNFDVMNAPQLNRLHDQMGSTYADSDFSQNTDWVDLAFETAMTNSVEASVSGGAENTSFFLSGNAYSEEGTLIEDDLTRFGGRVNISHDVTDNFTADVRLNGRYTNENNNPTGALYEAYTNLPWDDPRAENGSLRTGRESNWVGRDQTNFLYPLQFNHSISRQYDFNGTLELGYSVAPWLSFSTTNQATVQRDDTEGYDDARTQAGSVNEGELNNYYAQSSTLLSSNQFTFDQSVGSHNIGAVLGAEYETNHFSNFSAEGGGIFPDLSILNVAAEPLGTSGFETESVFLSGFSQLNYNYDRTYFASISFRRDGSSRFGENNRYGNFYSVSGSWSVSNESFLADQEWLEELKVRASYGATGNAQIGNFQSRAIYSFQFPYNGQTGARPTRLGNPNLTWEIAKKTNIGIDLNVFERFDFTIDAYQRVNEDLLQSVPQPSLTGFSSQIRNIGKVRNRGVEISLSTVNLQEGFRWTTDFNIGFNNNEVLELAGGEPILAGSQRIEEGEDLRTWYLRKWAGVDPETGAPLWERQLTDDEGNVVGTELTSNYNEASRQMLGSATPDFTGGFRNTFEYKGVSLSAFFNFVYGNDVYHSARELFDSDGGYLTYNYMELEDDWSRWQEPGDDATHPKPVPGGNNNSNSPSSRYLEDGSYLRLKNVRLSYNVPDPWADMMNLQSARLYVSGDNLVTFTDFSGMDPEVGLGGNAGTKYPISRKVMFGVGLTF
jgi:TonB-linked SusC/RagA family outer membrane protein